MSDDHGVDLGHLRHDALERAAGLRHQLDADVDLGGRVGNQRLDLLGRFRRTLRQRAHFGGDDGEAAARLAGARRLDARVEREQIGLEGDLVDDADDLADLLRRLGDRAHRLDRLTHHDRALLGVLVGGGDHLRARGWRPSADFFTVAVTSLERRGGLLETRGLLFGAARQIVGGGGDFLRARLDRARAVDDR